MRLPLIAIACTCALTLAACGSGSAPPEKAAADAPAQATAAPAAAATPAAASEDALAPLFGTWGLDPSQCTQTLKISRTRFEGPGGGCDISGYSDNGDGTFTADMNCGSGADATSEQIKMRPIFAPTGEGIDLTYLNRDNLASTVLRCDVAD